MARLLLIRPGGLGDAALTAPLIAALATSFPAAELHVLAERRNAGVYAGLVAAGRLHRYDVQPWRTWRTLRRPTWDLIIDTEQYHHASTLVANALRPRYLCGFDSLGRRRLQTHSAPYSEDRYEVQSFLDLARALTGRDPDFDPSRAFLPVSAEAAAWAAGVLGNASDRPLTAIAPAAAGAYKLWPPARYATVARWLVEQGHCVVLLGGADAVPAATAISGQLDPQDVLDLTGRTTLAQTMAILARAGLSLSADTGVMHLAYGVGTATVALFGPGLHRKWAPPGPRHRTVRTGVACSPCTRQGRVPPCPNRVVCMADIAPSDVIAAIESLR